LEDYIQLGSLPTSITLIYKVSRMHSTIQHRQPHKHAGADLFLTTSATSLPCLQVAWCLLQYT